MRIEIKKIGSWERVVDAARFTVRKEPLGHEPSDKFKKRIVFAEHSPIRLLEFDVKVYDVPKYIIMHLVRHHQGIEKFVSTSRPDRNGFKVTRHEQRADDPVNCQFSVNVQALINISRVRLCNKAEKETHNLWNAIITEIGKTEPIIAAACVPNCIYRGVCPEAHSCGFDESSIFKTRRFNYIRYFKEGR